MSQQDLKVSKVLLVDDEKFIRTTITDILTGVADTIVTANNGKEGFEKALAENPDVIISDVMMPEMSGFEFLKAIRKNCDTAKIPFVILTVKDTTQDLMNGYDLDADYYMPKPFKSDTLLHAIEKAIFVRNKKDEPENELDDELICE